MGDFVFRSSDVIGFADASTDTYLSDCFVETDNYVSLRNMDDPRSIVLGRTGAGKTALLRHLWEKNDRVIQVKPEALALAHISNSTILSGLSELGVKLDIFFRLLWRHVFVVEIIRAAFSINTEERKKSFLEKIRQYFGGEKKNHAGALEYLEKWSGTFWKDTDYRVRELTTRLESDLQSSIEASLPGLKLGGGAAQKLEESQRIEVIQRAQEVVNRVQIRELSEVMDMLAAALEEEDKSYFIVVDRLDENWVEDGLRYLLVRALVETVRDFAKIKRAKLIVVLRRDLIDRVFRKTRDAGFQEEKYRAHYLPVMWSKDSLVSLLDARLSKLARSRGKKAISAREVMGEKIDGELALDYIVDRTMLRPRDAITFVNLAIQRSEGRPRFSAQAIREAEGDYSRDRLRSIADEWFPDYPNLLRAAEFLKKRTPSFALGDLLGEVGDFCCNWQIYGFDHVDDLSNETERVVNAATSAEDWLKKTIYTLYVTGIVGLKIETYDGVCWAFHDARTVSLVELRADTRVTIHKALWRVWGIQESRSPAIGEAIEIER